MGKAFFVFCAATLLAVVLSVVLRERFLTRSDQVASYASFSYEPVEAYEPENIPRALLGGLLFRDTSWSASGTLACVSCHDPMKAFSGSNASLHRSAGERYLDIPSLVDLHQRDWFFWDGRADSLQAATLEMIRSKTGLNSSLSRLVKAGAGVFREKYEAAYAAIDEDLLAEIEALPAASNLSMIPNFKPDIPAWMVDSWLKYAEYPAGSFYQEADSEDATGYSPELIDFAENMLEALVLYQNSITTLPGPFEEFLDRSQRFGMSAALVKGFGKKQMQGLMVFNGKGQCSQCHSGPFFSDQKFHYTAIAKGSRQRLGRMAGLILWNANPLSCEYISEDDPVFDNCRTDTKRTAMLSRDKLLQERSRFRTPGLRHLEKTAPYLHDGSFQDIKSLLEAYQNPVDSQFQTARNETGPLDLNQDELEQLESFLRALQTKISDPYAPK